MRLPLTGLLLLSTLSACGGREDNSIRESAAPASTEAKAATEKNEPKQIGQQRSGDYIVTLFNKGEAIKPGANRFTLEVRDASTKELVPVGEIHIETSMEMQGQTPMIGAGSAVPGDVPGRYVIGSDFAAKAAVGGDASSPSARHMAGVWKLVVTFQPNQQIEFTANVELAGSNQK